MALDLPSHRAQRVAHIMRVELLLASERERREWLGLCGPVHMYAHVACEHVPHVRIRHMKGMKGVAWALADSVCPFL